MFLQTPYITHVPVHKQSNYSAESRRETEQSEKQAHDERVPLNWWVWNGNVFMLNAAPPQGHGSSAVPSPCLRAPLIIPFKWNVNPHSPQFLPCQYLFDFPLSPHLFSISPTLFLFLLILCLSLSQYPLSSISSGSFQLPAAVFPFLPFFWFAKKARLMDTGCSQLRQESSITQSSTNQSGFINTSAIFFFLSDCGLDLINSNKIWLQLLKMHFGALICLCVRWHLVKHNTTTN